MISRVQDKKIKSFYLVILSLHQLNINYIYESCDNPLTLNTYQMYRDDENEGLKFYTDPDYIYHLWIEDQNQKFEKKAKDVS